MLSQKEIEAARQKYGLSSATTTTSQPDLSPRMQRLTQVAQQAQYENDPRNQFMDQPQKQDGFFKSLAKDVASPFVKVGASAYQATKGVGDRLTAGTLDILGKHDQAQAYRNESNKVFNDTQHVPGFGDTKTLDFTKPKEAVGTGLELASNFIGAEGTGSLAKAGIKGAIKEGAKIGAKTGLEAGLLGGTGRGLQEDKSVLGSLGQGVVEAGTGAAGGAVLGGALGAASKATSAGLNFVKQLTQPEDVKIATNRFKELKTLENSYGPLRKQIAKAESRGIDINGMLSKSDLLVGSVDNNGVIRTQKAIADLNDFMKPSEAIVRQNLEKEGKKIPLDLVKTRINQAINESGIEGEGLDNAFAKASREIKGLSRRADQNGLIDLTKVHDAKVFKYANIDYLNPQNKQADKVIAKALKEVVEQNTKTGAEEVNKELSHFYTLQKYLETLDGKRVQGGKLGKYFGRTLGGIAGSHFGPLGSIAGSEVGGKVAERQMVNKFGKATGNTLQYGEAVKGAINKIKEPALQIAGKVNDTLNEVTPGLSTKYHLTFKDAGKNATIKNIPKEELGGWIKYLENKGVKYALKVAGTVGVAKAVSGR